MYVCREHDNVSATYLTNENAEIYTGTYMLNIRKYTSTTKKNTRKWGTVCAQIRSQTIENNRNNTERKRT